MPRNGSQTQSPRQPTMRRGASIAPMMRHGMTRLDPVTGQELVEGVDFLSPVGGIGHSRRGLPALSAPQFKGSFTLSGVSRDSSGVAMGSATVDLFKSSTNEWLQRTTSDGSGNFSFTVGNNAEPFFIRAYKAGAPDVAGTSKNALTVA